MARRFREAEPSELVQTRRPPAGEARFLAIAPHAGFLVPEEVAAIVDLDSESVLESLFRDADPFTDEFDFAPIGGVSVNYGLHRLAGDANRDENDSSSNGFARRTGFDGRPLLKKGLDFTQEMLASLRESRASYYRAIDREVASLRRARPGKPVFMLQIHSMDAVAGASYGAGAKPRPDIGLIVGERDQFIGGAARDAFRRSLEGSFPGWSVALNEPFSLAESPGVFHLLTTYGKPREGLHALELEINKARYLRGDLKDAQAFAALQDALLQAVPALLEALE